MGKLKNVALAQAPIAVRRQLAIDPTDSAPTKVIRSRPAAPPLVNGTPTKFAYALKPYTCERRPNGWHVCRTPFSAVGEKPDWAGPFATLEDACLAIARRLATEAADRHSIHIGFYKLKPGDPLHGLKPTTRLKQKKKAGADTTL